VGGLIHPDFRNDEFSLSRAAIFASRHEFKKPGSVFPPIGVLFASLRHCNRKEEK
jgi:hypothetical protein